MYTPVKLQIDRQGRKYLKGADRQTDGQADDMGDKGKRYRSRLRQGTQIFEAGTGRRAGRYSRQASRQADGKRGISDGRTNTY